MFISNITIISVNMCIRPVSLGRRKCGALHGRFPEVKAQFISAQAGVLDLVSAYEENLGQGAVPWP